MLGEGISMGDVFSRRNDNLSEHLTNETKAELIMSEGTVELLFSYFQFKLYS